MPFFSLCKWNHFTFQKAYRKGIIEIYCIYFIELELKPNITIFNCFATHNLTSIQEILRVCVFMLTFTV